MKTLYAATLALLLMLGCTPAASPSNEPPARAAARSAIMSVAYGTKTAMDLCERVAVDMATNDKPTALRVAKACDSGYAETRAALIAAQSAMDVWTDASEKQLACAARDAFVGLVAIRDAVSVFVAMPQAVDDALGMGRWASALAGGVCAVQTADGGK